MGYRVKTLDEIKDSRLLYEKKVPPFGFILISVVLIFMGILTYWAYKTPKESVIKAAGVVQSKEKNYVMSPYTGEVLSVNYKEGMVVSEGDVLYTIKSTDLDLQMMQLEDKKELLDKEIVLYKKYITALESKENLFDDKNIEETKFYNMYEAYKNQCDQITVNEKMLKAYGYTDNDIKEEIERKDKQIEQLYLAEINKANEVLSTYNNEIATIDIQCSAINVGKSEYEVKATKSGKIHVLEQLNQGMMVQTGTKVCSIAKDTEELEIIATVSEADATKIKKGDNATLAVSGLTQSVYGTITGKVISKDVDVTVSATGEGNVSYFKIIVEPDYNYVISKNGEKVNLSNGMGVETRIIYDQVTYLYYALDAFGIRL